MFTNADQELTADQVKDLLGRPPLMPGESEEEYWIWWTASVQPEKPKTFCEWMEANDLAHLEWEQKRLRYFGPALVRRKLLLALTELLRSYHHKPIPEKVAHDYFGNNPTEQRRARQIVASYGISQDEIVAEAVVSRGEEMLIIDRMVSNRAIPIRHLRNAIERRAETGSEPTKLPGDQGLGVPGLAN